MPAKLKEKQEKDLSFLLDPIQGPYKAGKPLRYTEIYDDIREARRAEDERLSQGVWKAPIKKADWARVDLLCQKALHSHSKDLQIVIWLTEAQFHLKGLEGLREGLKLVLGLTRSYWEELYPHLEGNGYELRLGLYAWLNTRLSEDIAFTPLTLSPHISSRSSTFWEVNKMNQLQNQSQEEDSSLSQKDQEDFKKISESLEKTPYIHYDSLNKSCISIFEILKDLEAELHLRLETKAPSFSLLKEKLKSVQHLIQTLSEQKKPKNEDRKMKIVPKPSKAPPEKKSMRASFENREQAYAVLEKIAAYLERVEPHSPTPYLIRRAIAWGEMSLSEVVSTVLKEEGNLTSFLDILNVKNDLPTD